jgi:hypothetical protein
MRTDYESVATGLLVVLRRGRTMEKVVALVILVVVAMMMASMAHMSTMDVVVGIVHVLGGK